MIGNVAEMLTTLFGIPIRSEILLYDPHNFTATCSVLYLRINRGNSRLTARIEPRVDTL